MVCHSKFAAIWYQKAIHEALAEQVVELEASETADLAMIEKIRQLKAAVIISSDGTNEQASVTTVRQQAREWNAVKNFCKPFAFDDPEQTDGTIAFLVVCDMLLTGFDAPIEQVMYIDKRLREHTLLQAIARTNRVRKGKQRGFIVDYIGLTHHLTEALAIYGNEVAEELSSGLKSMESELPVLQERYERLLQLFTEHRVPDIRDFVEGRLPNAATDAAVVHAAVTLLKDERLRADFDVYLKGFLASLDIILPNRSAQPYRVPARRFGFLLDVAKKRYQDETLNLGDAGEKVRALINEHLISLGINPKVPPVELLSEGFMGQLERHSGGNAEAKASEMEHAIRKHCTVHHNEDPAFYKSLSEKVEQLIAQYKDQWEKLAEELEKIRTQAAAGRQEGEDGMSREATTFYQHIANEAFENGDVPESARPTMIALMEGLVEALQDDIGSIDYWNNSDKQKRTRSEIKRALMRTDIAELKQKRERIAIEIMKLAKSRRDDLLKGGREG